MAAVEALEREQDEVVAGRSVLSGEVECGFGAAAASAAYEDLALVLAVEVDEVLAAHEVALHAYGTRELGLLVAGKHALDGPVLDVVAGQDGQLYGVAYAVVGTQRGALGTQPVAVDVGLDGVVVEVEVNVDELVAHHVHVALQHHGGAVFVALGGRLLDEHVASLVDHCLKAVALAEVLEIFNHFLLVL